MSGLIRTMRRRILWVEEHISCLINNLLLNALKSQKYATVHIVVNDQMTGQVALILGVIAPKFWTPIANLVIRIH